MLEMYLSIFVLSPSTFEGNRNTDQSFFKKHLHGTSPAAQWLSLYVSTAEGPGSIPAQGMKFPHTAGCSQKEKNRKKIKKQKQKQN